MKIKKNGKVINLTESDLRRIVKKVIKEKDEAPVADATTGEKTQWKFEVTGFASKGGNAMKSTIILNKVQLKDPKTKKPQEPFFVVYVRDSEGRVKVGKILSNNKWSSGALNKLYRQTGACTKGAPDCSPAADVVKAINDGIKNAIGVVPTLT